MILDSGICTVFRASDASSTPGGMPVKSYAVICQSWYKELSYETSPTWHTEGREELRADGRIRIMQHRDIRQNDFVVLEDVSSISGRTAGTPVYRITRAYHGEDGDSPDLISDLTLEVVQP